MGLRIAASWIDSPLNVDDGGTASPAEWREHWEACINEASVSDVLLFLDLPGETQCGSLIELGAALASGRRVFIVSQNWWSIEHHSRVAKFDSLAEAIAALPR